MICVANSIIVIIINVDVVITADGVIIIVVKSIVPDQKFKYMVDIWKSPSIVPAVLKVVDIAGLIRGASEGAGLGNAFLSHIAAVDGIFHLIRAFDSDEVIHVDDR